METLVEAYCTAQLNVETELRNWCANTNGWENGLCEAGASSGSSFGYYKNIKSDKNGKQHQ